MSHQSRFGAFRCTVDERLREAPAVLGIDPGNDSTGWVLISPAEDGNGLVAWTVGSPWRTRLSEKLIIGEYANAITYVEVPQNGTYASRGGVHWAAGMAVVLAGAVVRKNIRKIKPGDWWPLAGITSKSDDTKALAKKFALRYLPRLPDDLPDDLYDAACIALYGLESELQIRSGKTGCV